MDKDSKILITGGQGFIGKKLGAYLSELGFSEVHSLAGTRSGLDLGEDASLGWAFNINPEVVVHLATRLPSQENCLEYPAGMMYENLFVTTKVMEEARMSGCKTLNIKYFPIKNLIYGKVRHIGIKDIMEIQPEY